MAICAMAHAVDVTATQPSVPAKDPKEQMIEWQKTFASMDVDTAMHWCHTETDAEATYARGMAEWAIIESKVQKTVRDKWGAAVESAFAHINETDTLEDDQSSTVQIDDENAVVFFKSSKIEPTPMTLVDGQWRLDVHLICEKLGKDLSISQKFNHQMVLLLNETAKDIAAAKYPNAAAFLDNFQQKMDNLSADSN